MRDRPEPGAYTAGYVESRLEDAGRTLMALPWAGCFPAGVSCLWPETGGGEARRYAVPTSAEVSAMGQAYDWIPLIADTDPERLVMMRRLVLMRSLVRPDSPIGHPVYVHSWRRLGAMLGLHRETLQTRWGRGIDAIVARLNRPGLCTRAGGRVGPGPDVAWSYLRAREMA
jgi:hypothetical protein